ncbi:hypothetical protein [Shewanella dokdonensis]|uniref:Uncharacterized protein n=1 Tax=Shewanella dokdonensis TaxID=712036 RepID=A0ABX8DCJ3_9GAMM|nr:hypothetical protein [Shewanella dokdonensis]MCL1074607.1 hypothetical protein [Shewanella dokdonensis]QVK22381.1 hypothetical protein KHX94_13445 [Shewanella dokdonensis]
MQNRIFILVSLILTLLFSVNSSAATLSCKANALNEFNKNVRSDIADFKKGVSDIQQKSIEKLAPLYQRLGLDNGIYQNYMDAYYKAQSATDEYLNAACSKGISNNKLKQLSNEMSKKIFSLRGRYLKLFRAYGTQELTIYICYERIKDGLLKEIRSSQQLNKSPEELEDKLEQNNGDFKRISYQICAFKASEKTIPSIYQTELEVSKVTMFNILTGQ